MLRCEVCGRSADVHHIVHRCEGGLDHPLNYKCLCQEHHRGKNGPHKSKDIDLKYKLELQKKLEGLLQEEYYPLEKLCSMLELKPKTMKRLLGGYHLYKEGYRSDDVIYELMGRMMYDEVMLEHYYDFMPVYNFA